MNLNIKIFLLCPIPEDQKPINQYISLKENSFLNLPTFPKSVVKQKIRNFFFQIFFFCTIVKSIFFFENFFSLIQQSFFISFNFLIFFFLILFFRWKEIENSFANSRIFYEEASWYDGEIWEKPISLIKNDKLIQKQKIKPLLKKLKDSFFSTFFSFN